MLADLGFYLTCLCFILSIYGVIASISAALTRHRRLYRSSRAALNISTIMCVAASLFLWYLFFQRDYSVAYIAKNSSNDLPELYTLTAFWSSLEGSHYLWTLLMALFSSVAVLTYSKENEHIMPYVCASLQGVLGWMYFLAISYSDPFVRMFPVPDNGQGMNALLQNPYMSFHPPSLFVGYTALAIPFAYSLAALAYGDITQGWLKTVRRWTLFGWAFLTTGIFLGGRWAYVELGWAGYWAWDPVENSSFIPWLFSTALLHSLLVQDKLGHLKRLSMILAIMGFFFSFFGTFITRSGVITSVHSFAQSPVGPNYLYFLAGILIVSLGLYAWRAPSILPPETNKVWGVSKESALIITQFLLLTFVFIVVVGTLFPIVSEAITDQRISVQAPYFNMFAPYLGLGFILAVSVGNIMRYHSGKIPGGAKAFVFGGIFSLPFTVAFCWAGDVMNTPGGFYLGAQLVGIYLSFAAIGVLTYDFYLRLKDLRYRVDLLLSKNLAYVGAYLAHIGLMIAILGFLGNYRGLDIKKTLTQGETSNFYGYAMTFEGMKVTQDENAILYQGPIKLERAGEEQATIYPARSKYPTKPELLHEIAVKSHFWHDLYIVMADFDQKSGKTATFEIYINPTVRIVWISAFFMVIGGIICLFDKYRGDRSRDALV